MRKVICITLAMSLLVYVMAVSANVACAAEEIKTGDAIEFGSENERGTPETAERVASGIISDLRTMKAACLMLYFDRMDEFDNKTVTNVTPEMLAIYTDNPDKFQSAESPYLSEITADGKWWIGFDLKKAGAEDAVKEHLKERAESVGLRGAMDTDVIYTDQDVVWLMAR